MVLVGKGCGDGCAEGLFDVVADNEVKSSAAGRGVRGEGVEGRDAKELRSSTEVGGRSDWAKEGVHGAPPSPVFPVVWTFIEAEADLQPES